MDVDDGASDPPQMQDFLPANSGARFTFDSNNQEDDFEDDEDEDDEDMEITEAIALNIHRKHSLSLAQQQAAAHRLSRRRSSFKPPATSRRNSVAVPNEVGNESVESSEANQSRESDSPMEFTVPLDSALRKPRPPSDAWLALQAVANSSTNENANDEDDMELTTALGRLQKARESLSLHQSENGPSVENEDSFTSTDDSGDSIDLDDRTLNVTSILGGVQNLEISGEASLIVNDENTPRRLSQITVPPVSESQENGSATQAPQASRVFSAPPPEIQEPPQEAPVSLPQSDIPTPSKSKSSGDFTPAGANSLVPPSPRPPFIAGSTLSVNNSTPRALRSPSPNHPPASPAKRRASVSAPEASQPSPAKKRATGLGLKAAQDQATPSRVSASPAKRSATTPSKGKSPAPAPVVAASGTSKSFRRPSGYFAQRRSLLPSSGAQIVAAATTAIADESQPKDDVSSSSASSHTSTLGPPAAAARRPRASLPALTATVVKHAGTGAIGPTRRLSVSRQLPVIKVNAPKDIEGIVEVDEEAEEDVDAGDAGMDANMNLGETDVEDVVGCVYSG
jgi:hypothetical protein